MKKVGEDSAHSWVILAASSIISFITSGLLYGPTGVLYVAYLDTTQCTAQESSWVTALTPAMSIIGGPLGAVLSTMVSIRTIIISGILMGFVGVGAGYFSLNFYFLLATYGVLHGIGCSLASTALSALINNAFSKYRETAMGIFTSVTPISGAIMPILTQTLYDLYGLQGTLLLLGGIYLHAMLGAVLFMNTRMRTLDPVSSQEEGEGQERHELGHLGGYKPVRQDESQEGQANQVLQAGHKEVALDVGQTRRKENMKSSQILKSVVRHGRSKMLCVLQNRGFHLSNFTLVMGNFFCLLFSLITVDLGIQNGLLVHQAVHLMTIYSAGQLFGRLCLGWISERNYVTRPAYFAVTHLTFSVICVSFSFSTGFGVLAFLSATVGIILGNLNPLSKVVYSDYLKKDEMVIAMYMSYFMVGVLAVIRSASVGHIRDVYGNYENVYYFMGFASLITSLVWTYEYFREKKLRRCNVCCAEPNKHRVQQAADIR